MLINGVNKFHIPCSQEQDFSKKHARICAFPVKLLNQKISAELNQEVDSVLE